MRSLCQWYNGYRNASGKNNILLNQKVWICISYINVCSLQTNTSYTSPCDLRLLRSNCLRPPSHRGQHYSGQRLPAEPDSNQSSEHHRIDSSSCNRLQLSEPFASQCTLEQLQIQSLKLSVVLVKLSLPYWISAWLPR